MATEYLTESVVRAQNLVKEFSNGESTFRALDGVSVEIQRGEMVAIMGPSGSGKSTLMTIIGLLDVPTSGSYWLDGQDVGQQAPITLLDTSRYQIKVAVDEVDVARVAVGQPVDVLLDALGAPVLKGTVRRIAPLSQADNSVTAYEVTIEVDPAGRPIKPGMTASASIISERREGVLQVPAQAVSTENGASVVSVVTTDQDGKQQVTTQPVELGLRAGDQVEIRGGLSEGQQVLVK